MEKVGSLKYQTIFDPKLTKRLLKLPEKFRQRLRKKVDRAETDPFKYYDTVEGTKHYKLRVGDYRVIVDIKDKTINIRVIEHRGKVYKNL